MKKLGIAGGVLFFAYGVVRWIDGTDGAYGPGLAWTVGHLLFLLGIVLFAAALIVARPARRVLGTVAAVAGLVGIAAFVRVILIDLIVGFRADTHADMPAIRDQYDRWPGDLGIYPTAEILGPILFLIGLLGVVILLTIERRLPVRSPFLVLAGFVAISVNLDLMPLGGLLLAAAFVPARRPKTTSAVRPPRASTRR